MNTKASKERRYSFEDARFFNHVPPRTLDTLTDIQRRDIAHTIFELQRNNPRVLREIYLDNPFIADEQSSEIFRRIKRRFYLVFFSWWGAFKALEDERRRPNRIADLIFMFISSLIVLTIVIFLLILGYMTKSAAGIDLIPGIHLFCTD